MNYNEEQAVVLYDNVMTAIARISEVSHDETLSLLIERLNSPRFAEEGRERAAINAMIKLCKATINQ
jgi:hypothetical protein